MPTQREADRQRVLERVQQSIDRYLDRDSVKEYIDAAREYGERYGIESAVEDWYKEGRNIDHSNFQELKSWMESLP